MENRRTENQKTYLEGLNNNRRSKKKAQTKHRDITLSSQKL